MIDYIKYTIDDNTYSLIDNGDGTWSKETDAPNVCGNYALLFEISENGIVSYIDSADSRYSVFLKVIESMERKVFLLQCLPEFLQEITEFQELFNVEDLSLDQLCSEVEKVKNDMFITTASNDAIIRKETFLKTKGQGTLEQRKNYLISLNQKGKKLNRNKIKSITNTITGSDCIVTFFGADEINNPEVGYGVLRVQVLSPDNNKDYRYEDILRALKPLVPSHVRLLVVKYFALWEDVKTNFSDWTAIATRKDWQAVKSYIPPQ